MAQSPVTVAIVEDEPVVFATVSAAIRSNPKLDLVQGCTTALDMMRWLAKHPVDVLLVDLGLPDRSGIDVIKLCRSVRPECEIMVLSIFGDAGHMVQAFEAGARGYLIKDGSEAELARHVLDLRAGGSPMSPMIASQLLARWQQAQGKPAPAARTGTADAMRMLSSREHEVLQLVARGCTYQETATHLSIAVSTVQAHVRNIYGKLDVHNKAEALYEARQLGLLD